MSGKSGEDEVAGTENAGPPPATQWSMPENTGVKEKKADEDGLNMGKHQGYKEADMATVDLNEDENKARGNWSRKLDFFLSCVGYAVGLGNVWRFPYLCYANGGGAFLIPYAIMLFFAGIPLFFLELAFGQFHSSGPITVWEICPIFKGVGYAMVVISGIVAIYYNVIIAYAVYYLVASFDEKLPWVGCDNEWNTPDCGYPPKPNGTIMNGEWIPQDVLDTMNVTLNITQAKRESPSQEFWTHKVLELSDGIDNPDGIRWQLFLCLLLAWVVVFLSLIRGVKSSGKVVYFTALFPYVVLVILLIRGLTLPGSFEGVKFYMTPKWELLLEAGIWKDAATQIFYSLGPGWGGLLTMASYNKFHNNCYRDAWVIPLINCGTSVFAGFVVFSIIGFMAHDLDVPIPDVVSQGPGLVFVVYPEAVSRMPISQFWSILFFFMLFTLGLDTQFVLVETVISSFSDEFPLLRKRKGLFACGLCFLFFLLGLPLITKGGIYMLEVMNWYSAGISLMMVAVFECFVIGLIYGFWRFWKDIELMLGFRPCLWPYFTICWVFFTPFIILFIIGFGLYQYIPVYYESYVYPTWAEILGWLMVAASLIMIPIFMFTQFCFVARGNNVCERLRYLFRPTPEWGPALEKHRSGKYALKHSEMNGQDMENTKL